MSQWTVGESKADPGTMEVRGSYLVADHLPIEDATLISAAPDLLEALEWLLENDEFSEGFLDWRDRARAAIAKARGEKT